MDLIYNSLMINDIEHLFTCLLVIYISSLEKYKFFCPFLNLFLDVQFYELFIYVRNQPLISHIVFKYFIPFSKLSFHCVSGFFSCEKFLNLIRSHLFIFAFISFTLGHGYKTKKLL